MTDCINYVVVTTNDPTVIEAAANETTVTVEEQSTIVQESPNESIVVQESTVVQVVSAGITGPTGPQGPSGGEEEMTYAKRTDFVDQTAVPQIIYRGEAAVGSAESASVWRIRRLTIAADDDVKEEWADGVDTFSKVWNDRATYAYS